MNPVDWSKDERPLEEALRALRRVEARAETPPHVERAVMAAWDAHPPVGATFRWPDVTGVRRWQQAAALAAGVVLTVALGRLGQELRDARPAHTAEGSAALLLVGEPILDGELVRVVRMRMPAATLADLGVRSTAGDHADAIDVDVIVGEDGVARAIRLGM